MDGGNAGNAGAIPDKTDTGPANVPYNAGISHIHVGHDYQLSDKTAGQSFCAAEELPEGRCTWMYIV
jgi:hypothetical protein